MKKADIQKLIKKTTVTTMHSIHSRCKVDNQDQVREN